MIRILLAHPSRLVCDSLRSALDNESEVYVVGTAATAEELRFLLPHGNLILLALELEDATAIDLLPEMRMTHPQVKVVILGNRRRLPTILRYIEAGAVGYIWQNEPVEDIVRKLTAAHKDKAIVSPKLAAALMEHLSQLANRELPMSLAETQKSRFSELTPREQEVLRLIAQNRTNHEIANELMIACGTVKNHVHNILKKLEVKNRQAAAAVFRLRQPALAVNKQFSYGKEARLG